MKHRHARRARVIFCDLKAPAGGSSTRWTLNSYDKGNSFMFTGPGFHSMTLWSLIVLHNLKWLSSLIIDISGLVRATLFLLFSWYPDQILKTDNKRIIFLFFCRAILSLEQVLEGSQHLSLHLLIIPLHHPLHTKIRCLSPTPL